MAIILDEAAGDLLDEAGGDIFDELGGGISYLFSGPETLVYPSYIDVNAQHTLVAQPQTVYEIEPPPGTNQPAVPPDGFWTEE